MGPRTRSRGALVAVLALATVAVLVCRDGLIGSLDDKVSLHRPDLSLSGGGPDFPDAEITWRHLLQQTAGSCGLLDRRVPG